MQTSPEQRIKIIITDDHSLYREGVKNSLKKYSDIEVIAEAENGLDLLNKLKYLSPDIIIMGIQMPVMDGLQALPLLKKNYPHIKVIILSMLSDQSVICRMIEEGANTYLNKNAGSAEIYEAILACHRKWFYINETVMRAIREKSLPGQPPPPPSFSEREIRVMEMLKKEIPIQEIATLLDLSPRTIEAIIDKMKSKADVKSKAGLLNYAVTNKLID